MSRLRHPVPIIAFTDLPGTRARNALIWGVQTYLVRHGMSTDELIEIVDDVILREGLAEPGDRVVMVAGAPPGVAGSTNNVRVHTVGAGTGENY